MYENFQLTGELLPISDDRLKFLSEILHDDIILFKEKHKELWGEDTDLILLARHRLNALPVDLYLTPSITAPTCQACQGVIVNANIDADNFCSVHSTFECRQYKFKVIYERPPSTDEHDEEGMLTNILPSSTYIKLFKTAFALDFPPNVKRMEVRLPNLIEEDFKQFNGTPSFTEFRKRKWMHRFPANRFETEYLLRSFRVLNSDILFAPPKTVELIMNLFKQLTVNPSSEQIEKFIANMEANKDNAKRRDIWNKTMLNYLSFNRRNIILFYESDAQASTDSPVAGIIYEYNRDNSILLKSIWVNEEHRGKGYGTEIISGLVEEYLVHDDFKHGIVAIVPNASAAIFNKLDFRAALKGIQF